jgi:hypothetical protein
LSSVPAGGTIDPDRSGVAGRSDEFDGRNADVDPWEAGPVGSAIAWLLVTQTADGDVPSYSSSLLEEPDWQPDRPNFITALCVLALDDVAAPELDGFRDRARAYLLRQREPGGRWRYWSSTSPLHDYTPQDADDTACCAMALGEGPAAVDLAVLLANRDGRGRFYTWFVPHGDVRSLRHRWALRAERTTAVLERRSVLWENSEAEPDDVDVTVNANVVRMLGASTAPVGAVEWIASVVEAGTEVEEDKWYRSRTALYRSVAVARFAGLRDLIVARLTDEIGPDGCRDDLERADALRVLRLLDAPGSAIRRFADDLLDRQRPDGSWDRSICYFGGPQESFAFASEALSTAAAVGALSGLDDA